jgi:hypothetical protein
MRIFTSGGKGGRFAALGGQGGISTRGDHMRSFRLLSTLLATALIPVGIAAAASDELRPHHFMQRGVHWQAGMQPGEPGPSPLVSRQASSIKIKVLGHHDPGGPGGDVVAHRGFAYMGSWAISTPGGEFCRALGVRVYNLANPRRPRHVSTFADGASNALLAGSWTEKVIVRKVRNRWFRGDLAVVSFQDCRDGGFKGIGLYDVTHPRRPELLALRESGMFGVHELWMETRGRNVYVYEAAIFHEVAAAEAGEDPRDVNPEFRVVDVSNPRQPVQIGDWSAWRDLGEHPFDGLGADPVNFVHSVVVFKKIAYVSYWDFGTVILDVSDPSQPEFLGRTEYGPGAEGSAHSAWTARGGRILIQTDEDFHLPPSPGVEQAWGYAHIFNVSDKSDPVELATFKLPSTHQLPPPGPGDFTVHDPKVVGNTLYLSWYTEGVVLVDISRPRKPRFLAQFIPPEKAEDPLGVFFPGEKFTEIWGVFPYRNYVLASDMNNGLWIFKVVRKHDD